jgi:hypothetical protein
VEIISWLLPTLAVFLRKVELVSLMWLNKKFKGRLKLKGAYNFFPSRASHVLTLAY